MGFRYFKVKVLVACSKRQEKYISKENILTMDVNTSVHALMLPGDITHVKTSEAFHNLFVKKNLKIPKGQSETVNRRSTNNTMAKRKRTKGQTTICKTLRKN